MLKGADEPLAAYPDLKILLETVDERPTAAPARAVGTNHTFKHNLEDDGKCALFPSNDPPAA